MTTHLLGGAPTKQWYAKRIQVFQKLDAFKCTWCATRIPDLKRYMNLETGMWKPIEHMESETAPRDLCNVFLETLSTKTGRGVDMP